jgi:hypothetical protein
MTWRAVLPKDFNILTPVYSGEYHRFVRVGADLELKRGKFRSFVPCAARHVGLAAGLLVLSLLIPAIALAVDGAPGAARGTLTVGGSTVLLGNACLTWRDPLITLHLSDVPLTTRLIDTFSELRAMAAAGRLHLISLRIHLPTREVTGIEVLHSGLPYQRVFLYEGNLGAYDFTLLGPDRVEGTARTTGPLTGDSAGIGFEVSFTALPASWEPRNRLDGLTHRHPAVGRMLVALSVPLSWVAGHIGPLFFGLVALILLWIFVFIPRRQARFFRALLWDGYSVLDRKDLMLPGLLDSLLPFAPGEILLTGPEARPRITRGVRRPVHGGFRVLARAWRNEVHHKRSARSHNEIRFFSLVMESRPLHLEGEILVVGKGIGWPPFWLPHRDELLGVREISGEGSEAFAALYSVAAPGGKEVAVPARLQEALVGLADHLVASRLLQSGYLGVNLRFTPAGWGMIGDQQTGRAGMARLLEVADRISDALTGQP